MPPQDIFDHVSVAQPKPSTWDRVKGVWREATETPIPELVGRAIGPRAEAGAKLAEYSGPEMLGLSAVKGLGEKLAGSKNRIISGIGKGVEGIGNFEEGALRSSTSPVGLAAAVTGAKPIEEAASTVPILAKAVPIASRAIGAAFAGQGAANLIKPRALGESRPAYLLRLGEDAGQIALGAAGLRGGGIGHPSESAVPTPTAIGAPRPNAAQIEGYNLPTRPAAMPEMPEASPIHPEEKASLEAQAGRPLTDTQAQALAKQNHHAAAVGDMLAGNSHSVEPIESIRQAPSEADVAGYRLPVTSDAQAAKLLEDKIAASEKALTLRNVSEESKQRIRESIAQDRLKLQDGSRPVATPVRNGGDIFDKAQPEPSTQPRSPMTEDEIRQGASRLGLDADKVKQAVADGSVSPEAVVAGNRILAEHAEPLKQSILNTDLNNPANVEATLKQLDDYREVQSQVRGKFHSEAGRSLRATQIDPAGRVGEAAEPISNLKPEQRTAAIKGLQLFVRGGIDAQFNSFLHNLSPATTGSKMLEGWINALLSGTAVPAKAAGDLFNLIQSPLEELHASGLAGTAAHLKGLAVGIPDAFANGWRIFARDLAPLDAENLERSGYSPRVGAIGGTTGYVARIPSRSLQAISAFFHSLHFDSSLYRQAVEQASREGLSDAAFDERVAELRQHPSQQMRDLAGADARQRTFTQALGPLGQKGQRIINEHPGLKWAIPFTKVPANLVKLGIEESPLGFLSKGRLETEMAELSPERAQALSQARAAIGTALGLWAWHEARAGRITSSNPPNGEPRNSIQIDGHWISYDRLPALSVAFGAAAAAGEAYNAAKSAGGHLSKRAEDAAWASFGGALDELERLPFISDMNRLAGLSQSTNKIKSVVGSEAGTIIPQGVAEIAESRDPYERQVTGPESAVMNRIPGLRERLPVRTTPGKHTRPFPNTNMGANAFSPIKMLPLGSVTRPLPLHPRKRTARQ